MPTKKIVKKKRPGPLTAEQFHLTSHDWYEIAVLESAIEDEIEAEIERGEWEDFERWMSDEAYWAELEEAEWFAEIDLKILEYEEKMIEMGEEKRELAEIAEAEAIAEIELAIEDGIMSEEYWAEAQESWMYDDWYWAEWLEGNKIAEIELEMEEMEEIGIEEWEEHKKFCEEEGYRLEKERLKLEKVRLEWMEWLNRIEKC